jgi:hypothetical protein
VKDRSFLSGNERNRRHSSRKKIQGRFSFYMKSYCILYVPFGLADLLSVRRSLQLLFLLMAWFYWKIHVIYTRYCRSLYLVVCISNGPSLTRFFTFISRRGSDISICCSLSGVWSRCDAREAIAGFRSNQCIRCSTQTNQCSIPSYSFDTCFRPRVTIAS